MRIYEALQRLKSGSEHLNYGREVVQAWSRRALAGTGRPAILDIGLGEGTDLALAAAHADTPRLVGVDSHPPFVEAARSRGVEVVETDIERASLPLEDSAFDLVIANQVFEHVKEVFWVLSEISRVLRPGGHLMAGVPNLASLHSRIGLLLGLQPTCIKTFSAHVRGFTRGDFLDFATRGGFFALEATAGANFYPFPPRAARFLARLLPSMAVSAFFLLRRTDKPGTFIEVLEGVHFQTPFYAGEGAAK
jgi:SAM-dependent methyltransferase